MKIDLKAYAERHPELARNLDLNAKVGRKYGNRPTEYNGVTYHSALEARVAAQLDLMQKAGLLTSWSRQVKFVVGPGITYVADFVAYYPNDTARVIDAKGVETPEFKLKRKLFQALHGPLDVIKSERDIPQIGGQM